MPGQNLKMAREGSQFAGDGVNLSWPLGGNREISPKPEFLSRRLQLRIANGSILETDEEATVELPETEISRILTGQAARDRMAEPGTPRVLAEVRLYDPDPAKDKRLINANAEGVHTVDMEQVPVTTKKKAGRPRGALLKKEK